MNRILGKLIKAVRSIVKENEETQTALPFLKL